MLDEISLISHETGPVLHETGLMLDEIIPISHEKGPILSETGLVSSSQTI